MPRVSINHIMTGLALLTVSACALPSTPTVATTPVTAAASNARLSPGRSTPTAGRAAKVGDAIKIKGNEEGQEVAVSVVKVVATAAPSDEFMTPATGNRYVAVQFKIVNTGTAPYDDSPSNGAKALDAEGQQFDASLGGSRAGPSLPASVKLAPGGTAKGYITFEVPKAAKITGAQFSMNSGFGQTAQWRF